jgi:hypothetical protein
MKIMIKILFSFKVFAVLCERLINAGIAHKGSK